MKLLAFSTLIGLAASGVLAADVNYAVVAFPQGNQGVAVSVGGQNHALQKSNQHPNLFMGTAPSADTYQYVLTDGQNNTPETTQRKLAQGTTNTGNEFFNRSQTVYPVPPLPQAYNPQYPTLFTGLNRSNEIATVIMQVNASAFDAILKAPLESHKDAQVTQMAYISSNEVYNFNTAGIKNSGQSTKDFAKQSYAIDLNSFNNAKTKNLLFGRTAVKLRAHETDPTMAREKLFLDFLAAAGGASLSGSWVRLYINNEPYGLFLMTDDASTHFIDNVLHGGNWANPSTGATYKGNAMDATQEGNLVYIDDNQASYSKDLYKVEDSGEDKSVSKKNNTLTPLIDFMKQLSQVNPQQATDSNHQGTISNIIDPTNTMIHLALSWLGGSWDGVWRQASNYYLNQDIQTKKWTLISYDFDETFGNAAPDGLNTVAYTNYSDSAPGKRPLVDAFIKSPYYSTQFEDIVKTIVKRFFNPRVVEPRLQAWIAMLKEDIEWSRAIAPKSPGTKTTFTLQDFQTNMMTTDKDMMGINDWIKSRADATCKQLSFTDTDDLPPLGPYTGGFALDSNGKVVPASSGNGISPSGGSNSNAKSGASSVLPSLSLAVVLMALTQL